MTLFCNPCACVQRTRAVTALARSCRSKFWEFRSQALTNPTQNKSQNPRTHSTEHPIASWPACAMLRASRPLPDSESPWSNCSSEIAARSAGSTHTPQTSRDRTWPSCGPQVHTLVGRYSCPKFPWACRALVVTTQVYYAASIGSTDSLVESVDRAQSSKIVCSARVLR